MIGDPNTPQATFSLTIHLYAHAPSVELEITGNHGDIDRSVLFPKSYGAGLHHLSIRADALLEVNAAGAGTVPTD